MIILGIETSCDETSSSILKDGKVLSNVICSHLEHEKYGGVVPEIASKNHEKLIYNIVKKSINESKVKLHDISAISVTYGPGLIGSLLIGLNFAKGLSVGLKIPFIGVNHLEGHLNSCLINRLKYRYPYLCLLVSGGHTQIILVNKNAYNVISTTVDDAAGEAFDKGAKILGLKYPGGPEIEKFAMNGDKNKYKFTIPYVKKNPLNFSFSGMKTALLYMVNKMTSDEIENNINSICSSYQEAILNTLFDKISLVLNKYKVNNLYIVGGVSANKRFRDKADIFKKKYNIKIIFPKFEYCTDNAAMIAMTGYLKFIKNIYSDLNLTPKSKLKLGDN